MVNGVSVFSLFLVFATGTDKKHGKPTVIIALWMNVFTAQRCRMSPPKLLCCLSSVDVCSFEIWHFPSTFLWTNLWIIHCSILSAPTQHFCPLEFFIHFLGLVEQPSLILRRVVTVSNAGIVSDKYKSSVYFFIFLLLSFPEFSSINVVLINYVNFDYFLTNI